MDSSVVDWLHFGMYGMIVGTVIIGLIGSSMRKEDRNHVYLAGWITLIAATAYYAMSIGFGTFFRDNQYIQLARYADWVITTPLLLISLLIIAMPKDKTKERTSIIAGIIGLDVYMIMTGLFATLTSDKWPWYVFSCIALALIGYMLYVLVLGKAKAAGTGIYHLFSELAIYLSVLWIAYPVIWYLSGSGQNKISFLAENAVYSILDLLAKVGFGIILLIGVKSLANKVHPKQGEPTVETAAK